MSIECDAFHLINGDERRCRDGDNLLFNNREEVKIRSVRFCNRVFKHWPKT